MEKKGGNLVNRTDFIGLLEMLHTGETELHEMKSEQYADVEDTLKNFKKGALALGMTPREYCIALMEKHRQALLMNARGETPSATFVEILERVGDIRLYMALYLGLTLDSIDPSLQFKEQWFEKVSTGIVTWRDIGDEHD